jgi:hypothetical protein
MMSQFSWPLELARCPKPGWCLAARAYNERTAVGNIRGSKLVMSQVGDAVGVEGVQRFFSCRCGAGAEQRVPAHRKATVRELRSVTRRAARQVKATNRQCNESGV